MYNFERYFGSQYLGYEAFPGRSEDGGTDPYEGESRLFPNVSNGNAPWFWFWIVVLVILLILSMLGVTPASYADSALPGADASDKLEAAGTLLRLLDTALFKWGARIFAGICIMSSAWSLKEQRFGIAIICIVGALIFGTAPTWVRNIFAIGAGDSVFGN